MSEPINKKSVFLPVLSLFTSAGTLLCCALPALFVSFGAGAVLAGVMADFPQLAFLSKHKIVLFIVAGLLLIVAGYFQYRARYLPCPADPIKAKACMRLRRISVWIYGFSVLVYCTGFFFAFVAVYFI